MNFATIQYLIFFTIVFVVYWNLNRRWQNGLLLVAAYYFYANWDWRFLGLIFTLTVVNFVAGPRILAAESHRVKKFWLVASLTVSLAILGFFKYFHFFANSLATLAQSIGWHLSEPTLRIILPVGISFYTFQSISYVIDIYRGELKPSKSFIDFAAFVSFFPHLVAGPIIRASEFVFQLEKERDFSTDNLQIGLQRFLFGLFKKLFVADTVGMYLVDPVFAHPADYSSPTLWLALIGWSVQIYADFSGYSSMAIGSARMLGFIIPENFMFPYLSKNIAEYWRRWHMTMSRFFRDYVYIGLGGSRRGFKRSLLNIAITTTVSGLWHGAGWTFVVWGWLHGSYIVTNQIWRQVKKRYGLSRPEPTLLFIIPAWMLTQAAISLTRILFRSPNFGTAFTYAKGLLFSSASGTINVPFLVWVAFGSILIDHIAGYIMEKYPSVRVTVPVYARAPIYAAMIIFLFQVRPDSVDPYVYFQF